MRLNRRLAGVSGSPGLLSIGLLSIGLLGVLLCLPAAAGADGGKRFFFARMNGFEEAPSVVTGARGRFAALLIGDTLHYSLRWRGLEGGDPAESVGAHIHIGRRATNGAIAAFLCGGPLPPCSGESGEVSGTITADDVGGFGSAAQGVGPGEFDDLLAALRAGAAYINLHTPDFPGGEVRGQVR